MTGPSPSWLAAFVSRQLAHVIPDGFETEDALHAVMPHALERTRHCVAHVRAWHQGGFDPLVSGQYATLLYFLGHDLWRLHGDTQVATRLFLLNKALHGLDLYYELPLPAVFFLSHTPGLVLAKASYGSHVVFHQGCTVGRKGQSERPTIDDHVVLFPGAMVIGRCHLRAGTVVAPGVCLVDVDTPGDCYVLPGPEGVRIMPARRPVWQDFLLAKA